LKTLDNVTFVYTNSFGRDVSLTRECVLVSPDRDRINCYIVCIDDHEQYRIVSFKE
jgi:hypothetical protein